MKYKTEQERQLVEDLVAFQYDPLGYALYAYPWGEAGTPLAQHDLRAWQRQVLVDIGDHTKEQQFRLDNGLPVKIYREAVRSGRGPGKSALFAILSGWHASCHIGSSTVVTANTEGQLRSKTFPEFARWFTMAINSHWWHVDGMKIYPRDWLAKMVADQLKIDPHYWVVIGQNWSEENPDAFAGYHNAYGLAVLYDEASGIPEPIWSVTNGFFTETNPFRYWLAFSNPRRNSGAFYNRFNKPEFEATWRQRHINCREIKEIDQSIYDGIISEHGENSDEARVEVFGEFPEAGDNQLIPNYDVRGAQKRELLDVDETQALILGVDPAPRGRTVLRARQGRDARSIPRAVLNGADNIGIANAIIDFIDKYDPDAICIDAGNGTGVIDILRGKRIRVTEVWFGERAENPSSGWATRGSELWGEMAKWLPGGAIDDSSELFRDLTSRTWQWHGREESVKILTSKKEMAREGIPSPDDGDALAVTFASKVTRRNVRARRGAQVPQAEGVDYDIFG